MKESESLLSIAAVEREVGISKDVLRVWERRYGFPQPLRDRHGERAYPPDQVNRLRLVKRLMDQGFRPGGLLPRSAADLEKMAAGAVQAAPAGAPPPALSGPADELLASLRSHDATGLARLLQQNLAILGMSRFVQDILAPMTAVVGDEWARGGIQVFEEHLFTETCTRVLRQAIATLPPGDAPVVLLTTVPDESHGLGLLMAESLLALHGARCICLGTGMPVADIVRAAEVYRADVVALSFSSAFAARRLAEVMSQLRAGLPKHVEVWAGGAAVRKVPRLEGVQLLQGLGEAVERVEGWRAERRGSA